MRGPQSARAGGRFGTSTGEAAPPAANEWALPKPLALLAWLCVLAAVDGE